MDNTDNQFKSLQTKNQLLKQQRDQLNDNYVDAVSQSIQLQEELQAAQARIAELEAELEDLKSKKPAK